MPNLSYDVVALDKASATFIKMAEQVSRLTDKLDKLDGKVARVGVTVDNGKADTALDGTEAKVRRLNGKKATVKVDAKVDKSFAESTVLIDRFLGSVKSFALPAGILAATPAVVGLAGAATQLTGVLGLVPAVGLAVGTALGTVKLATHGMGDAFKAVSDGDAAKLNEALQKLSPNARSVVTEYTKLKPALTGLQLDVQDKFWANIAGDLGDLAGNYLPVLQSGLGTTASAMNELVNNTIVWLNRSQSIASVTTIFDNVGDSMYELGAVGADIVDMLLNIAAVGSDFLPGLAAGFGEAADNAAAFVQNARDTGKLHDWISNALSILGNLSLIVKNLGVIFHNVWTAAGTDADGFIETIRKGTDFLAKLSGSVQGQTVIADFFTKIRDVVAALLPLAGALGIALYQAFVNIAPVLPSVVKAFTDVLAASSPLIAPLSQLAISIVPALAGAVSYLAPVLGPVVAMMAVARAATAAWAVATGIAGAAQAAYAIVMGTVEAATVTYNVIAAIVRGNINLWATAQWLLNAAMEANPIGVVVIAVAALVAGLVLAWNHSETFRKVVMAAWDGIKTAAGAAWAFLAEVFAAIPGALATVGAFFTGLWTDYAVPAWNGITSVVATAWQAVQDAASVAYGVLQTVFTAIGGAVTTVGTASMSLWTDYISPAFSAIAEAGKLLFTILATVVLAPIVIAINLAQIAFGVFRDMAVDTFNTLSEEAQIWWGVISTVWNAVVTFLASIFVPAYEATRDAVLMVFQMISDGIAAWWAMTVGIFDTVVSYLSSIFSPAYDATRDAIVAAFQAVSDYIASWWAVISAIFNAIVTFLVDQFVYAYNLYRDAAITAWTTVANMLQQWWTTISALWNQVVTYVTGAFVSAYQTMQSAVTAAWMALQQMLQSWWQFVLANVWQPIVTYIIGPFVTGFNVMRDAVMTAWNAVRDGITAGWNAIRDNVWNPMVNFITKTIPDGFNTGVAAIGRVWDSIKRALRDPVQAAIDVVWNNGIVKVWNDVANAVGLSTKLSPYNLPAFAAGGPITGGTPGKDSVPILAMPGEFMFSKKAVDAAGGMGAMHGLMSALTGMPVRGGDGASLPAGTAGRMPMYADGGGIGGTTLTGSATTGATTATGSVTASTDFLGILGSLSNIGSSLSSRVGGTPWGQLLVGYGTKLVSSAVTYLTDKVKAWMATLVSTSGGTPPAGSGAVVAQVMQAAQGFGWASGPQWAALSWIISHESGWNPNAQNPTSTAYGLFQFLNGTWGTVGGSKTSNPYQQAIYGMRYIQSRYGSPVGAQGFWQSHGWYANGGIVDSPTFGLLGEAGPEVVLPLNRPDRAANLADRAGIGNGDFHVHVTTSAAASADHIIRSAMFESRLARMSGRYGRRR